MLEHYCAFIQQPPISLLNFEFTFCHDLMKCANIRFLLKRLNIIVIIFFFFFYSKLENIDLCFEV